MDRLFISFLGVGPEGEGYDSLTYFSADTPVGNQTAFVQRAIIESKGEDSIDKVLILCTQDSFSKFYQDLKEELVNDLNINPDKILCEKISRTLNTDNQWALFSLVNQAIGKDDRVIFDFTHGFRLLSIIMSAAIGFIQTAKPDVVIEHVFYGQKQDDIRGELVDMKAFYVINEWAHGVDRFTAGADMGKLVALASEEKEQTIFSGLNNKELIEALNGVSRAVKDVHANKIGSKTHHAFEIIQKVKSESRPEENELLEIISHKLEALNVPENETEFYGGAYLQTQLNFARMLSDHGLYMQSFTVMRELIVSIGMLGCKEKDDKPTERSAGEMFFNLCQISESKWMYTNKEKKEKIAPNKMAIFKEETNPFYQSLKSKGIADILHGFAGKMADIRNGFDHAWTGKSDVISGVEKKSEEYLYKIEDVLSRLKKEQII